MGKLIIIRHGETAYNVEGRYCGSTDIGLNERGFEQAKILAEKLKSISLDIIISSTMRRARETASVISEELKLPVIEMEEFVERSVGVYEGLTREEAKNTYPEMWERNSPEGAEPMEEVEIRVSKAIHKIKKEYGNKDMLIVAHGYITKIMYKYFNNASMEELAKYTLKNCECEEYSI